MNPFFQVLDAERVHVPDASEAARKSLSVFDRQGRPVTVTWNEDGTVLVAPAGLEPLLFVTDPTTTWEKVRTS